MACSSIPWFLLTGIRLLSHHWDSQTSRQQIRKKPQLSGLLTSGAGTSPSYFRIFMKQILICINQVFINTLVFSVSTCDKKDFIFFFGHFTWGKYCSMGHFSCQHPWLSINWNMSLWTKHEESGAFSSVTKKEMVLQKIFSKPCKQCTSS